MKKFIVLTHPRTGSELLMNALAAHSPLVRSELLNPQRYQEWRRENGYDLPFRLNVDTEVPISEMIFDQTDRLAAYVQRAYDAFDGFKITYDQITPGSPVMDVLKSRKVAVIFMNRNLLECAVSYWFALRTQRWERRAYDPPIVDRPEIVDPAFVEQFCRMSRAGKEHCSAALSGHETMVVNYDELIADWSSTTTRIQEFIGLVPAELPMLLDKRLSGNLGSVVLNWDELKVGPWS